MPGFRGPLLSGAIYPHSYLAGRGGHPTRLPPNRSINRGLTLANLFDHRAAHLRTSFLRQRLPDTRVPLDEGQLRPDELG